MPEYRENELCYEDYRALRTLAGWETHSEEQTRRVLAAARARHGAEPVDVMLSLIHI